MPICTSDPRSRSLSGLTNAHCLLFRRTLCEDLQVKYIKRWVRLRRNKCSKQSPCQPLTVPTSLLNLGLKCGTIASRAAAKELVMSDIRLGERDFRLVKDLALHRLMRRDDII